VVATVLVGLNEPHVAGELSGEQLQVTPMFFGSLVIDATRFVFALADNDAGGLVVSETDGVPEDPLVVELELPPHPNSATATARQTKRTIVPRNLIDEQFTLRCAAI
jgi:hypothetical protein